VRIKLTAENIEDDKMMKNLSVFALAAIMTFAVAASAQNPSDTPSDQPQAATEMQNDQSPAAPAQDVATPATDDGAAAPVENNSNWVEVNPEHGVNIVAPIQPGQGGVQVSVPSDERGQNQSSASEAFPDLNY
jgi:hypothetical protein